MPPRRDFSAVPRRCSTLPNESTREDEDDEQPLSAK
jgi:hypothetical protein